MVFWFYILTHNGKILELKLIEAVSDVFSNKKIKSSKGTEMAKASNFKETDIYSPDRKLQV